MLFGSSSPLYVQASWNEYSCWLVILTPYNLPPEIYMTKPYMFLTCLISGLSSPKAKIDMYLQLLIDYLKRLWIGEWTYDISYKQNFTLGVALMWTINDFSAYDMLSGWGTHGKMGCPHCMEYTKVFTLRKGGKVCGMTVTANSYQNIMSIEETRMISKRTSE